MNKLIIAVLLQAFCLGARAAMGLVELPASDTAGRVTVFYPTAAEERDVRRGDVQVRLAPDAAPRQGNGALVIVSPGSSASPWLYLDVARALVEAGFVVAMPEHHADNDKDLSEPGPPSWKLRPLEVSRAIDALVKAPALAPLLQFDRVGMYGMSAGGHTALSLAGGRWSPGNFRRHCQAHIAEDFQTCVGLITQLTGGVLDGVKTRVASWVIGLKFTDDTWYEHHDPRIKAIIAGVPLAADFDPSSLSHPKVKLGIISARQDRWLVPRFHSDVVLRACANECEHLADLQEGGHGALLSPLPLFGSDLLNALVADPPGFDRAKAVPELNALMVSFFQRHLGLVDPGVSNSGDADRRTVGGPSSAKPGSRQP